MRLPLLQASAAGGNRRVATSAMDKEALLQAVKGLVPPLAGAAELVGGRGGGAGGRAGGAGTLLLAAAARRHAGPAPACSMQFAQSGINSALLPPARLAADKYKGQAGKVAVIGGCREYTGAPYFASISALKVPCCTAAPCLLLHAAELALHSQRLRARAVAS